jgi:hypothetical protein
MNWKLIFLLSLVGLAMALESVFLPSSRPESLVWPVAFVVYAFVIARRAPGKYFLHGFLVGFTNWVWVAAAHVIFRDAYVATHAKEVANLQSMALPGVPPGVAAAVRAWLTSGIPIPGLSGLVIGLLAWIASRFAAPKRKSAPAV